MSTTLTLVMCSLLFFPLNRDAAQHQRNRSLNSQTDSEILYTGHLETKLTKQVQSGKPWRSFWTGVISALGYPSEIPFRIRTYDSAAYKPLVPFVVQTSWLGGSWNRCILLVYVRDWTHNL